MVVSAVPFTFILPERSSSLLYASIPDPEGDYEAQIVWEREALIPFTAGKTTYAFLGPLKQTPTTTLFKNSAPTPVLAFCDTLPLTFLDKLSGIFNATPPAGKDLFHLWMNRVEAEKADFWRAMGIYDCIH